MNCLLGTADNQANYSNSSDDELKYQSVSANKSLANDEDTGGLYYQPDYSYLTNHSFVQFDNSTHSSDLTATNTSAYQLLSSGSNTLDDILRRFGENTKTNNDLNKFNTEVSEPNQLIYHEIVDTAFQTERNSDNSTRYKKSTQESDKSKLASFTNSSKPHHHPVYFDNNQFLGLDYRIAPSSGRWGFHHFYSSPEYQHPLPGPIVELNSPGKHFGMPTTSARWSSDKASMPITLASKGESTVVKKEQLNLPNALHPHASFPFPIGHGGGGGGYPHPEMVYPRESSRAIYSCCEIVYGKPQHQEKPSSDPIVGKSSAKDEHKMHEASGTHPIPGKGEKSCFPIYEPFPIGPHPLAYRYYRPFPFPLKWLTKALFLG